MIPISLGSVVVGSTTAHNHIRSARPDAPVVDIPRTSARPLARTRTATATVLVRAAQRISPA